MGGNATYNIPYLAAIDLKKNLKQLMTIAPL